MAEFSILLSLGINEDKEHIPSLSVDFSLAVISSFSRVSYFRDLISSISTPAIKFANRFSLQEG